MTTTQLPERAMTESSATTGTPWRSLVPVVIDVVVPVALYYVARVVFGADVLWALAVSSAIPAVRSVVPLLRGQRLNGLAVLVLAVNLAGIALSFVTGNARIGFAKNAVTSSVAAVGILWSTLRGRPLATSALKPWVTKGSAARDAAWDRLAGGSTDFARFERRFGLIWGVVLLAECVARLVTAVVLPVSVLGWLSEALFVAALVIAAIAGSAAAAEPMEKLVVAEIDQPAP